MIQIDEIGSIGERIMKLVDYFCQGNKTAFGRAADIQSGVLAGIVGGRESKPGFEILQKLLTAYPSVEPTWLLFGRGPMLKEELQGVAHLALPSSSEPYVTREQYENSMQRVAHMERIMNALIDNSPPEVAARLRQAADQPEGATQQHD